MSNKDMVLDGFLHTQFKQAMTLCANSDILELEPLGATPPQRYIATLHARGLVQHRVNDIRTADHCNIGIWLPNEYLHDDLDLFLGQIRLERFDQAPQTVVASRRARQFG